jgi:hypothetical protein
MDAEPKVSEAKHTQDAARLKGHRHAELGSASMNTDRVKFK